jgi:deoxyribodipyrimidine photo-lyase
MQDYIWTRNCLGKEYVGATMTTKPGKCAIGFDNTTKLSPWLAHGCLSPRLLYHEIEKYERLRIKNQSTYWLKHEVGRWIGLVGLVLIIEHVSQYC